MSVLLYNPQCLSYMYMLCNSVVTCATCIRVCTSQGHDVRSPGCLWCVTSWDAVLEPAGETEMPQHHSEGKQIQMQLKRHDHYSFRIAAS